MTKKEKQSAQLTSACFLTFAVLVFAVWGVNRYKNFSSPSSDEPVSCVHSDAPARFYSTIEKQRIMRDEGSYKGPIDGLRGTLTIDAEIEHAKLYNDWCNRQEMK